MNQYNGEKLATRARINSFADELDRLALTAAQMDVESGRDWRPIRDTADGAPFLYVAPEAYYEQRRSAGDFYSEGDLIWLDADVTIRRLTHDAKSLDDFCALWGNGSDHDFGAARQSVRRSRRARAVEQSSSVRLGGVLQEAHRHGPAARTARRHHGRRDTISCTRANRPRSKRSKTKIAIRSTRSIRSASTLSAGGGDGGAEEGTVRDVLTGSPAQKAGLSPGTHIVAIDGRKFSSDVLHDALEAHKGGTEPMRAIVSNEDRYSVVDIVVSTGERFPHLVRNTSHSDELKKIYAPKTFVPAPERAESADS